MYSKGYSQRVLLSIETSNIRFSCTYWITAITTSIHRENMTFKMYTATNKNIQCMRSIRPRLKGLNVSWTFCLHQLFCYKFVVIVQMYAFNYWKDIRTRINTILTPTYTTQTYTEENANMRERSPHSIIDRFHQCYVSRIESQATEENSNNTHRLNTMSGYTMTSVQTTFNYYNSVKDNQLQQRSMTSVQTTTFKYYNRQRLNIWKNIRTVRNKSTCS